MVTGMSGVGKSSLVRAGIVPLLTRPARHRGHHRLAPGDASSRASAGRRLLEGFAAALLAAAMRCRSSRRPATQVEALLPDPAGAHRCRSPARSTRAARRRAKPGPIRIRRAWSARRRLRPVRGDLRRDGPGRGPRRLLRGAPHPGPHRPRLGHRHAAGRLLQPLLATCRSASATCSSSAAASSRSAARAPPRSRQMIRRPAADGGPALRAARRSRGRARRRAARRRGRQSDRAAAARIHARRAVAALAPARASCASRTTSRSAACKARSSAREEEFARLPPPVQASLPQVLAALVHTDPTDERLLLQNRVPLASSSSSPECKALIDAFVAAHLFVGDQAPTARPWSGWRTRRCCANGRRRCTGSMRTARSLRLRSGISAAAALWRTSEYRDSRLLTGELLAERRSCAQQRDHARPRGAPLRRGLDRRGSAAAHEDLPPRRDGSGGRAGDGADPDARPAPDPACGPDARGAAARLERRCRAAGLGQQARANLRGSIETMAANVARDADEHPEFGSWSMAQMRSALHGPAVDQPECRARPARLHDEPARSRLPLLARDVAEAAEPVRGRLGAAVARPLRPAGDGREFGAFLDRQSKFGWWPIYQLEETDRNAAAGVTALTLYAIHQHLERKLVAPDQVARAQKAVALGVSWLLGQAQADAGRWSPYPLGIGIFEKGEYPGLSAFVMTILRRVTGQTDFDQAWLDNLPIAIPHFRDNEISKANLQPRPGGQIEVDNSRFYRFPWMLLATIEAQATRHGAPARAGARLGRGGSEGADRDRRFRLGGPGSRPRCSSRCARPRRASTASRAFTEPPRRPRRQGRTVDEGRTAARHGRRRCERAPIRIALLRSVVDRPAIG